MNPTQVTYPWRAAARTALAYIVGVAVVLPLIWSTVQQALGAYLSPQLTAWIAAAVALLVAISTAVTRVMAIPAVNAWLTRVLDLGAVPIAATAQRVTGSVATEPDEAGPAELDEFAAENPADPEVEGTEGLA